MTHRQHGNWLQGYYFSTPLFVLADSLLGLDFRISGLQNPVYRFVYYGVCLLFALLLWYRPRYSPLIGMGESSVNLTILMVGVLLPVMRPELDGDSTGMSLQGMQLLNFILTGGVLLAAFYSAQHRLQRQR